MNRVFGVGGLLIAVLMAATTADAQVIVREPSGTRPDPTQPFSTAYSGSNSAAVSAPAPSIASSTGSNVFVPAAGAPNYVANTTGANGPLPHFSETVTVSGQPSIANTVPNTNVLSNTSPYSTSAAVNQALQPITANPLPGGGMTILHESPTSLSLASPQVNDPLTEVSPNDPEYLWSSDKQGQPVSNPIEMFKGWSELYKGYDRSPIMFDSGRLGKKRKASHIGYYEGPDPLNPPAGDEFTGAGENDPASLQGQRATSIRTLNLGVDDEIGKSTWGATQPLRKIEQDFAHSFTARDTHFDLFKSVRGVALLTLSYLDKTVAAGLATTQAQLDAHTTNYLLKQINWQTAKIADPQRAQIIRDTEEKVEACLKIGPEWNLYIEEAHRIDLEPQLCIVECLRAGSELPFKKEPNPSALDTEHGLLDFCVCCAEVSRGINATMTGGNFRNGDFHPIRAGQGWQPATYWSLVERVFFGVEGPTQENEQVLYLFKLINQFRRMYGDVVIASCNDTTIDLNGNGEIVVTGGKSSGLQGKGFFSGLLRGVASSISYRPPVNIPGVSSLTLSGNGVNVGTSYGNFGYGSRGFSGSTNIGSYGSVGYGNGGFGGTANIGQYGSVGANTNGAFTAGVNPTNIYNAVAGSGSGSGGTLTSSPIPGWNNFAGTNGSGVTNSGLLPSKPLPGGGMTALPGASSGQQGWLSGVTMNVGNALGNAAAGAINGRNPTQVLGTAAGAAIGGALQGANIPGLNGSNSANGTQVNFSNYGLNAPNGRIQNPTEAFKEGYDTKTCKELKIEFKHPQYSVPDKVRLFRDGLQGCNESGGAVGSACPLNGVAIKEGICPAIRKILIQWPVEKANDKEIQKLWIQASMGRMLTGDDVNNMFRLMGVPAGSLKGKTADDPATWRQFPEFSRWLDVYCDASAVAAFKKFHYRMMSVVEDTLRVNQKLADYDRARVRDLMDRVTAQISLAEADLSSSEVADRVMAGLNVQADREKIADSASAREATSAQEANTRRTSPLSASPFGVPHSAPTSTDTQR